MKVTVSRADLIAMNEVVAMYEASYEGEFDERRSREVDKTAARVRAVIARGWASRKKVGRAPKPA